jgi:ABC-type transporter Mla subunit MlaD
MRARRRTIIDRLKAHQLGLGVALALFAGAVTAIAALSTNGVPFLPTYSVQTTLPLGAPNVRVGSDVRIAGVYEGSVASDVRSPDGGQLVRLNLRVSPIGRDARLEVRLASAAGGAYYISLQRGDYSHDPLPTGGTIPTRHDGYTESLTTVIEGFTKAALADGARSVQLAGAGLYDRGAALNQALDGLGTTVLDATAVLRAASPQTDLTTLVRNAGATAQALRGAGSDDAGRLTTAAADLFATLSDPASRLATTIDELPGFEQQALATLPQLDPVLARTTRLARSLVPAVKALRRGLPPLTELLRSGPTLQANVPPIVQAGTPALSVLAPVLRGLAPDAVLLARGLPFVGALASYLAQFPQEIDSGFAAYYAVSLYRSTLGAAHGYPVVPAMFIFTCVPGYNPNPTPGSVYSDHLNQPCH